MKLLTHSISYFLGGLPLTSILLSKSFIIALMVSPVIMKSSTVEAAGVIGKTIAERAVKNGVSEVVFDRGGYIYHGRVKALADAARAAGLKF